MKILNIMYTFFLAFIFISCEETSKPIIEQPETKPLFSSEYGSFWEYSDINEKKLKLSVYENTDTLWAKSFFDTTEKMVLPSSMIKAKYITSGFPETEYWAFGEKDSSIIFGKSQITMVKKYENKPAPYFFKLLELNRKYLFDTIIVRDTIVNKYGKSYRSHDSTVIYDSFISEIDSIPSVWKIKYFARRKGYNDANVLMEFELTEGIGFTKIDNFTLQDFYFPEEESE